MIPAPLRQAHTALQLRPFQAVRYDPARAGDLSTVISPPYDEMIPAHARAQPHHIARLLYAHDVHAAAGQLDRWLNRGVLRRDSQSALYVYQQRRGQQLLQRGLIGELLLSDESAGAVLPHEDVQPHVVGQRAAHMAGLRAQLEPLLLAYRSTDGAGTRLIEDITSRRPTASARLGAITHTLWSCTDPAEQSMLAAGLTGCQALIADGHHRHAACLRLGQEQTGSSTWDRSLALLVDSAATPLQLKAIHRVIPGLEPDKAAAAAADVARVRPLPSGPRLPDPDELVVAGGGRAWSISAPEPEALREALDGRPYEWHEQPAAIADLLLLARAWSVPDLPGAVRHVHDAAQALTSVAAPGGGTAVLLPAITEDTVRGLAAKGVLLPRKSTSFGPKPAAGLAMRVVAAP
ncbi:DUF1015 domain-containing protein [Streptomyces sp. NBC_00239]|uniref:DUF1015 domain-containing protein n=1 Tax=Streptomyces sp. NBC_00239 TaxID=2903640 RepID=UPI002E27AD09|nr:DUF1015 domain-containing protein [Streptomyces sp. NBC_00239]